jgi:hypothetical protein
MAHPASYPMPAGGSIVGVKRPGREAHHSPQSSACSYTSTTPYVFMARYLVKRRDIFYLSLLLIFLYFSSFSPPSLRICRVDYRLWPTWDTVPSHGQPILSQVPHLLPHALLSFISVSGLARCHISIVYTVIAGTLRAINRDSMASGALSCSRRYSNTCWKDSYCTKSRK